MLKYLFIMLIATSLFSLDNQAEQKITEDYISYSPKVECLVLEDENSILCKFEVIIDPQEDQTISLKWVNPNDEISRTRDIVIPAGDSSAYDFRYLDGREKGIWNFKIIYKDKEYTNSFEIK
ncbi:hypothetical protein AFAEC_0535 [Aliarcobacter faecis]|uniref:hypothetical protein n=1 Tax=Aliarcobacter faecis TaxID=1564138 RepID=UPI00047C38B6|nr:hypothetical protein [Aliarcobacter faecis]QKF72726.1 hypothetical protein AFAEC_0535 [Aliarcobacter faecis]